MFRGRNFLIVLSSIKYLKISLKVKAILWVPFTFCDQGHTYTTLNIRSAYILVLLTFYDSVPDIKKTDPATRVLVGLVFVTCGCSNAKRQFNAKTQSNVCIPTQTFHYHCWGLISILCWQQIRTDLNNEFCRKYILFRFYGTFWSFKSLLKLIYVSVLDIQFPPERKLKWWRSGRCKGGKTSVSNQKYKKV